MGNQLTGVAPSQILPVEQYLTDVPQFHFTEKYSSSSSSFGIICTVSVPQIVHCYVLMTKIVIRVRTLRTIQQLQPFFYNHLTASFPGQPG